MGSQGLAYRPIPDAAPGGDLDALVSIYGLAIRKAEEREKAAEGPNLDGRDDAKESESGCAARGSIPRGK